MEVSLECKLSLAISSCDKRYSKSKANPLPTCFNTLLLWIWLPFISKEILNGTIKLDVEGEFINELKDGTKKPIIKNINNHFRKPKEKLIDFVKNYNGSLLDFQDYAKLNYPSIDFEKLIKLIVVSIFSFKVIKGLSITFWTPNIAAKW